MTAQMDFEALLRENMGLDSTSIGSSTIEMAVRLRMAGAGIPNREEYWQRVRNSNDELQELIETVVVPETWFFRDREAFAALVRLVMENWLPLHPTTALRVLSVPCSTGEEPYSIVMALLDGGLDHERILVDALDISARALARAKQAEYGANSFRGEDLDFRDRYFTPGAKGYALAKWLPSRVSFRQGNLLSLELSRCQEPYDIIFCRNLLIYFDRPTQERIMRILDVILSPAGFLFVGGAETYLASRSGFTSVNQAMSFAFRKAGMKTAGPTDPLQSVSLPPLGPASVIRVNPAKRLVPAITTVGSVQAPTGLEAAQRLADSGKLREAAECCEDEIRQRTSTAETWYLLGLVRDGLGDGVRAAECYRKLLYLDPEHAEALTHLALLTEKQGDAASAGRLRERARRITARADAVAS